MVNSLYIEIFASRVDRAAEVKTHPAPCLQVSYLITYKLFITYITTNIVYQMHAGKWASSRLLQRLLAVTLPEGSRPTSSLPARTMLQAGIRLAELDSHSV